MAITAFNRIVFIVNCLLLATVFCATAQAQNSDSGKSPTPINIEITTHLGDQQVFATGDVISFFISLDKAAYLYAFYQDASGQLFQILPGPALADHYFQAGFYIPFPPQNTAFQFQVQAPYGEEQLWVFASDNGKLVFNENNSSRGIQPLRQTPSQLSDTIKNSSLQLFGHTQLIIHTRSR
jgi:hypothetical protein